MWILNDSTVRAVRKLKDSNGQYLWQPALQEGDHETLLGKKILTSPYRDVLAGCQGLLRWARENRLIR